MKLYQMDGFAVLHSESSLLVDQIHFHVLNSKTAKPQEDPLGHPQDPTK